jgi:hypothetical protein
MAAKRCHRWLLLILTPCRLLCVNPICPFQKVGCRALCCAVTDPPPPRPPQPPLPPPPLPPPPLPPPPCNSVLAGRSDKSPAQKTRHKLHAIRKTHLHSRRSCMGPVIEAHHGPAVMKSHTYLSSPHIRPTAAQSALRCWPSRPRLTWLASWAPGAAAATAAAGRQVPDAGPVAS